MNKQNRSAAIILTSAALIGAGFLWWATSTGPTQTPATTITATTATVSTQPSTGNAAVPTVPAPSSSPPSAPASTSSPAQRAPVTDADTTTATDPTTPSAIATASEAPGNVAAQFVLAYLTRDRDTETWADNWASHAGNLAGPTLQLQLQQEWAHQQSRVSGATATAVVSATEPLPGAINSDTEQSWIVTADQTETVAGIETPVTATVVIHLRLVTTDTGWVVDAILPQPN